MPRNAAKKLINEEVCLPKTITTNKTQQEPDQQATQIKQRKKPGRKSRRSKKSKDSNTLAVNTTESTSTTHQTSAKEPSIQSTTTVVTKSTPTRRKTATKFGLTKQIISTLYPIVIEVCEQQDTSGATTNISATAASETKSGGTSTRSKVTPAKGGGRRLRRRRSSFTTLKRRSKQKNKSLNVKIAPRESCAVRLASLRTRKGVTKAPTALQTFWDERYKAKLKNQAAWKELKAPLLNKIETIEFEVKKPVGISSKRRRVGSITTRKRSSTQKASNYSFPEQQQSTQPSQEPQQQQCDSAEIITVPLITVTTGERTGTVTTPTLVTTASTPKTPVTTPPTTPVSTGKKRARRMSVYERSSGVVTNGYLSSTRTSSASSSAVHSDADPQDIPHQFYVPVPAATGVVANTNASASNSALSSTGGNGSNALTYAPSMATLCNIGNTCYLNSVVYTLRFAPQFLHNLHHLIVDLTNIQQSIARQRTKSSSLGRGISAAQLEGARSWSSKDLAALEQNAIAATASGSNATGNYIQKSGHQLLTERLHELYQSLHRNEVTESTEPFHADTLLHAIQDVSSIFEGNQQQDAHEFLMCLLNSIRETCQTLIKAISECPDVILNNYIRGSDELDNSGAFALDRDALSPNSHAGGNSNAAPAPTPASTSTSSSSLSASNITKVLFSSRKGKRKEEAKNVKNSRLQSPLKDAQSGALQPTSNSLFYLNSVDLSGASSNTSNIAASTKSIPGSTVGSGSGGSGGSGGGGGGDGDVSPVSLLKDKERLAEKIRELGLDFFSEDFEGVTVSTTKCLSCETVTEQKESMIDIAVPVPISGYDSADYTEKPSSFIQNSCITREYFRGENKYRCEQCTGYTEAIRSISYEVLPRLLVIQLSRFSGGMEKINSYIPTSFTLQCFCAKCCELSDGNKLHIYKLYSVITHVGATMSVGHYIAYTCSLDWANEYVNCPKDRRMVNTPLQANSSANGLSNNEQNANTTTGTSAGGERGLAATSLMKKMKFGRSKASSSGDMSKNMKNLNGLTSKAITNGIGKLSMNTTCHSLNCCATRLCSSQQQLLQLNSNNDLSEETLQNGANHGGYVSSGGNNAGSYASYPPGYGSTGRGGTKTVYGAPSNAEPIWYMCDDDKIKAMTQREFEELLSPARKITVTPYLLFYTRFDLQTPQPMSAKSTGTPASASAQAQSWSNESVLSGSAGSSSVSGVHKM